MSTPGTMARLETILDTAAVSELIEGRLPRGGRRRQLPVRTLLLGLLLCQQDGRPAHLTRVHAALVALGDADRVRLAVERDWRSGPHLLTYRQVERTFSLVVTVLAKSDPDGTPAPLLSDVLDALVEASVPPELKNATAALAVDWSDLDTFSRPPAEKGGHAHDREASWGRRKSDAPGQKDELFFGYELQAATMVAEEGGTPLPELCRRILVTTCSIDPPRAFVPVLVAMVTAGIPLGDVLADSGYCAPGRGALGAATTRPRRTPRDGPPSDRPGTTRHLLRRDRRQWQPLLPGDAEGAPRADPTRGGAGKIETATHDAKTSEVARYKLGRTSADDRDGYHRVACPAVMGKVRCPLRPPSMVLGSRQPEILVPPEAAPTCCSQQTLTVPPEVTAKTAQKHDYPSKAFRLSYARRTAVERTFSTAKDRASNDLRRGWCRITGLSAISLFVAALFVVRNERMLDAFAVRQSEGQRRLATGRSTRRKRRRTLTDLSRCAEGTSGRRTTSPRRPARHGIGNSEISFNPVVSRPSAPQTPMGVTPIRENGLGLA
jgi:hypothetical protein